MYAVQFVQFSRALFLLLLLNCLSNSWSIKGWLKAFVSWIHEHDVFNIRCVTCKIYYAVSRDSFINRIHNREVVLTEWQKMVNFRQTHKGKILYTQLCDARVYGL